MGGLAAFGEKEAFVLRPFLLRPAAVAQGLNVGRIMTENSKQACV